ncbi:MAG: BMP family ABC transporter substrate-binding protein, partial [Clostridium sp.]
MKKRAMALVLSALMVTTALVGCSTDKAGKGLKVGMVTDSGSIDDKSFNEGTWSGIEKAKADLK